MLGHRFEKYIEPDDNRSPFEKLLEIFLEIMVHTSGDVEETFRWMELVDQEHQITTPEYTLEDFRNDLEKNGYLSSSINGKSSKLTGKAEQLIRKKSLDQIFGKLKKDPGGNHRSFKVGKGDDLTTD